MTVSFIVAYPKGSNINLEYYTTKHWPAVVEHWSKFGMTNGRLLTPQGEGEAAGPYELVAQMEWPDVAAFERMSAEIPAETLQALKDDWKNYSTMPPVGWFMDIMQSPPS